MLEKPVAEINAFSQEIHVEFQEEKEGKKIARIVFWVSMAGAKQVMTARANREAWQNR